jgi:hypothetical protein
MSNDVMNAHIKYRQPCGEDADFCQIADWAGGLLLDIELWYRTADQSDESWARLNEIMGEYWDDH